MPPVCFCNDRRSGDHISPNVFRTAMRSFVGANCGRPLCLLYLYQYARYSSGIFCAMRESMKLMVMPPSQP